MDRRDGGFYSVLGVEKASSSSEIRSAYRKLAMKWHPDKCSRESPVAAARFQQIQEAYSVLSDGNRILYDAGVYNSADNDAGMEEFMGEMVSMMSDATNKEDEGNSMEELENLFMKIIDADVYMANYEDSGQAKQDGTSSLTNHGEDQGDFDSFLQGLQFEQVMGAAGFCMGATGKVETPLKQNKQRKKVKKRKWNCQEKGVAASSSDYLST